MAVITVVLVAVVEDLVVVFGTNLLRDVVQAVEAVAGGISNTGDAGSV